MNRYIVSFVLTVIPVALHYIIKRKYRKLLDRLKDDEQKYYYHALFLNMDNFNCFVHITSRKECSEKCSLAELNRVLMFIASAKSSLSICMYMLTLKQINDEIIKAYQRGIQVRIVTDRVMGNHPSSKSRMLSKCGIPVKYFGSGEMLMHHKYCLVDEYDNDRAKVFFGSANLTLQAFVANFDNIIFTNDLRIVEGFRNEFEDLFASK